MGIYNRDRAQVLSETTFLSDTELVKKIMKRKIAALLDNVAKIL